MQRVFPSGDDRRCCVKLLELLMCKRPAKFRTCGLLYLRPLKKKQPPLWYTEQRVGESKIKEFMKTIAKKAGLDNSGKRFTNHSVRKTLVRKLQKGGVPNDKITAITGHKSEQSIAEYADTDLEDHRRISLLISHNAAAPHPTVPHSSPYNQPAPLNGHPTLQPIHQGVNPPTFMFNGCTLNITCTSTNTMDIMHPTTCPSRKRNRAFIDDSDED